MKYIKTYLLLLLSFYGKGQDTTITFTKAMVNKEGYIVLGDIDGWAFRQGNDTNWANNSIDSSGWQKLKPAKFTKQLTDKSGKLEGWLRLKIKIDTSFKDELLEIFPYTWAATDVYIDGKLMYNFGNSGANGKPFKEYNPTDKLPLPFSIEKGKEHLLAIHLVDFNSTLPPFRLKSDRLNAFMVITLAEFKNAYLKQYTETQNFWTVWVTINTILSSLFWLLTFLNRDEKNLPFIALASTLFTLTIYADQYGIVPVASYAYVAFLNIVWALLLSLSLIFSLLLMVRIFERKINLTLKISFWVIGLSGVAQIFLYTPLITIPIVSLTLFLLIYYIITSWKTLRGAQWTVQIGLLLSIAFGSVLASSNIWASDTSYYLGLWLFTGLSLSFPLSLLVYVSIRFKEIIEEVRENAKQVVQLSEEKKEQALDQQKILQEEVNRQTAELRNTLNNLKATQTQLIQSEKMASLGELTAGIAHEIQNPLNFVNNFSDVNSELIQEMQEEMDKGNFIEAKTISNDIKENEEKIKHHGRRADAIVKGMLQHSRTSSGQREPTDINALCDEYLRLAYHGLRAKDKSFNAGIKTDFEDSIGKINIIPQDIGRVILNLINNAFYAVDEKKKHNQNGYEPTVSVSTKKNNGKVEISVSDNGNGIPQKVVDKIFQPFFTTKPTGQGTGLGLSLSYDIVKAHGGEIKVETKEAGGTMFIVQLPYG
jgi:signal transduction histidine kinase